MKQTLRAFINELEQIAKEYGDNIPVCVYDDYTANEGWNHKEGDYYLRADVTYMEADEDEIEEGVPEKYVLIG